MTVRRDQCDQRDCRHCDRLPRTPHDWVGTHDRKACRCCQELDHDTRADSDGDDGA